MGNSNIHWRKALDAAAKARVYCYIISALYVGIAFYRPLGDMVLGRQRILYGLILVTTLTIVIATFYLIAFASHVQGQKNKAAMVFCAARARYFLIFQAATLMVMALCFHFVGEIMVDVLCVVTCFTLMFMTLKYITQLQRQDFREYKAYVAKYNKASKTKKMETVKEEPEDDGQPKSRVGANKAKKAAEKKRKK